MKTKIRSPACLISDSRCPPVNPSHVRLGDGCGYTAEIVAVEQISIAIFAQGEHKLGRRSPRHVDERRADTTQICVALIQHEPVVRCPIVRGRAAPDWAGLQPDNRFAAAPDASRAGGVTRDDEHVSTIARDSSMSPNSAFNSRCRPSVHVRRIIDIDANHPAMVTTAVAVVSRVSHVHDSIYESQSTAFFLHQGVEDNPIIHRRGVHIHRPTWISGARVDVQ